MEQREAGQNILHNTFSNKSCCGMGDRQPAIWFFSDTTKLHIRTGASGNGSGVNSIGNNGINPTIIYQLERYLIEMN